MPVQKGDVIQIPAEDKWVKQVVEWKQRLRAYEKNYFRAEFTNTRAEEPERSNFLYISEEKIDAFKAKATKIDAGFSVTVDDEFVFGQTSKDKNRWLVFHDRDRAMFQHRFVQSTFVSVGNRATEVMEKLGYSDMSTIQGVITGYVGHPLRRFERE